MDPLTAPLADVLAAAVPPELAPLNAPPVALPPSPAVITSAPAAVVPPPEWLAEPDPEAQTPATSVAADAAAAAWAPPPNPVAPSPPSTPQPAHAAAPVNESWDSDSVPDAWVLESAAIAGEPAGAIDPSTSVDAMLAMLAAEQHHLDAKQAPWTRYFDDKSTRVMIMVGGSVALAFGLFVVMAVLGLVF